MRNGKARCKHEFVSFTNIDEGRRPSAQQLTPLETSAEQTACQSQPRPFRVAASSKHVKIQPVEEGEADQILSQDRTRAPSSTFSIAVASIGVSFVICGAVLFTWSMPLAFGTSEAAATELNGSKEQQSLPAEASSGALSLPPPFELGLTVSMPPLAPPLRPPQPSLP
eukprot:2713931-Pleurochrysis_carterae.AAC.1